MNAVQQIIAAFDVPIVEPTSNLDSTLIIQALSKLVVADKIVEKQKDD